MVIAEALAETLQPRGERGLVGWALIAITICAGVVGHAFDIRNKFPEIAALRRPQGRAEHTGGVLPSQESAAPAQALNNLC
jgi:hypothetical protein